MPPNCEYMYNQIIREEDNEECFNLYDGTDDHCVCKNSKKIKKQHLTFN